MKTLLLLLLLTTPGFPIHPPVEICKDDGCNTTCCDMHGNCITTQVNCYALNAAPEPDCREWQDKNLRVCLEDAGPVITWEGATYDTETLLALFRALRGLVKKGE